MTTLFNMLITCIYCIATNKLPTGLSICWSITFLTLSFIFSYLSYYVSALRAVLNLHLIVSMYYCKRILDIGFFTMSFKYWPLVYIAEPHC